MYNVYFDYRKTAILYWNEIEIKLHGFTCSCNMDEANDRTMKTYYKKYITLR